MDQVRVGAGWIGWKGEKIPLWGAEFHYWRNKPEHWPRILERIRAAGFTVVTSFVQWNVHETAPGEFDFEGKLAPQRDLPRFLRAAGEAGLYVHLRPGPSCCEWRNSGGTSFGTPWRQCYDAYWNVVAPHAVTNGGSLLLQQIHNEWTDPIGNYDILYGSIKPFDGYHAQKVPWFLELCAPNCHVIASGYGFDVRELTPWLRHRYRNNPEEFQAAWGTEYATFEQPVDELWARGVRTAHDFMRDTEQQFQSLRFPGARLRPLFDRLDWFRCYSALPLSRDMDHARKTCDLPLTHNWAMMNTEDWDRLAHTDLSAYDHYMHIRMAAWEWIFMSADMAAAPFPFLGEFMTGTIERYLWGGQGFARENWERFSKISYLANGAMGMNLYMFVERDNWLQCPLDERGGMRPSYESFARLFHTLREQEWHGRDHLRDVGIVKYLPYHQAKSEVHETHFDRGFSFPWIKEHLYNNREPKLEFHDLFLALHATNLDFVVHKCPQRVEGVPDLPVLVCYSLAFMGRDLAEALVAYVRGGGNLVVYPEVPRFDEESGALDVFTKAFDLRPVAEEPATAVYGFGREFALPREQRLTVLDGVTHPLFTTPSGKPCGVARPLGEGSLIFIGAEMGASAELVDALLHDHLGGRKFASTDVPESDAAVVVHAAKDPLVVVYNGHKEETVQALELDASILPKGETLYLVDRVTHTGVREFSRGDGGRVMVPVEVPPRDATIYSVSLRKPELQNAPAPRQAVTVNKGSLHLEAFESTFRKYAEAESLKDWVRVDGKDWTLPAIAAGASWGVQGWFWLVEDFEVPENAGTVRLRLTPRGWHNLVLPFVNGEPLGRILVERPGNAAEFDATQALKPGKTNRLAIRLLRMSLDCHDNGGSGFEQVELRGNKWQHAITEWAFAQEERDVGERQGWTDDVDRKLEDAEWVSQRLPLKRTLQQHQDILWLRLPFEAEASEHCRVYLAGNNAVAHVWLNGEYVAKTPYLPVELPCETGLRAGQNLLAIRLEALPFATYEAPREERYRDYILEGLEPVEVEWGEVRVEGY